MIETNTIMSPRESQEHDWRIDEFERQANHAIVMKKLELELARENHQTELALKTMETKWRIWLKIPIFIVLLPLYLLLGIAYIVSMITKKEQPRAFWELLK